jgi:hypothetical protein
MRAADVFSSHWRTNGCVGVNASMEIVAPQPERFAVSMDTDETKSTAKLQKNHVAGMLLNNHCMRNVTLHQCMLFKSYEWFV